MLQHYLNIFTKGFINSYSQLFFADSKVFAWLLFLSSFINPVTGLSGFTATLAALLFAYWIGLDRNLISSGTYSYNALMIGLVLGSQYNFTTSFLIILIVGSVLSILLVVWFNTFFLQIQTSFFKLILSYNTLDNHYWIALVNYC